MERNIAIYTACGFSETGRRANPHRPGWTVVDMATYIKRARKYGSFVLQAPMDYPPDWMLFDVNKNQDVNPKYFPALARYYMRYLEGYKKEGIEIDYLSLFNEPFTVYTKIPYEKIRTLLRDHVGPALAKSGLKTKLMLSEAPDRNEAWKNYPIVLDDVAARKYVAVMPYHGYDFKNYDKIAELHKRYPDLPLWMTEVCYAYEAGTPRSMCVALDLETSGTRHSSYRGTLLGKCSPFSDPTPGFACRTVYLWL